MPFPPIYVQLQLTCLTVSFSFSKSRQIVLFDIFNELLSTQKINVARFARNVERDFFWDFQKQWHRCIFLHITGVYSCISKAMMMIIIVRPPPLWLVTPSSIFIGGHNPINNRVQRKQYLLQLCLGWKIADESAVWSPTFT